MAERQTSESEALADCCVGSVGSGDVSGSGDGGDSGDATVVVVVVGGGGVVGGNGKSRDILMKRSSG